jgi:outer membrane receptor protein involved in Fe transport
MNSEFETGLNLQFFSGRLGIDAAYYNRITSDQIFTLPIDPSTGYNNAVVNFGEVRNRGVELLLNTTPVSTKDFRWDLALILLLTKTKFFQCPKVLKEVR